MDIADLIKCYRICSYNLYMQLSYSIYQLHYSIYLRYRKNMQLAYSIYQLQYSIYLRYRKNMQLANSISYIIVFTLDIERISSYISVVIL